MFWIEEIVLSGALGRGVCGVWCSGYWSFWGLRGRKVCWVGFSGCRRFWGLVSFWIDQLDFVIFGVFLESGVNMKNINVLFEIICLHSLFGLFLFKFDVSA